MINGQVGRERIRPLSHFSTSWPEQWFWSQQDHQVRDCEEALWLPQCPAHVVTLLSCPHDLDSSTQSNPPAFILFHSSVPFLCLSVDVLMGLHLGGTVNTGLGQKGLLKDFLSSPLLGPLVAHTGWRKEIFTPFLEMGYPPHSYMTPSMTSPCILISKPDLS